jgi:hypothetical protein
VAEKVKTALVSVVTAVGPELRIVSGGVVSAGVGVAVAVGVGVGGIGVSVGVAVAVGVGGTSTVQVWVAAV